MHATVDALGNPTGFLLTPRQAHDLKGADILVPYLLDIVVSRQHKALDFSAKGGGVIGRDEACRKLRAANTNGVRGGKCLKVTRQIA